MNSKLNISTFGQYVVYLPVLLALNVEITAVHGHTGLGNGTFWVQVKKGLGSKKNVKNDPPFFGVKTEIRV